MPQKQIHLTAADRQAAYRKRKAEQIAQARPPIEPPKMSPLTAQAPTAYWNQLQRDAELSLRTLISQRRTYHQYRTEAWQESERGEHFEEVTDELENAYDALIEINQ